MYQKRENLRVRAGALLLISSGLCAGPAVGAPLDLPVCPADGQQMSRVLRSFIGVSGKELHFTNPHQPDVATASQLLADAGVHYVAVKILWHMLEPNQGYLQWQYYDDVIDAIADHGLVPVVTIRGTPTWASSNPHAQHPHRYPPSDISDWSNVVGAIVDRYGSQIHNWVMWNEPNQWEFFLGTFEEYLQLLNAGFQAVKQRDPHASVWAPEGANHPWNDSHSLNELLLQSGQFDVLSLHEFFFDLGSMMNTVQQARALLDLYGRGDVHISVTEVNFIETIVDCEVFSSWPEQQHAENLRSIYACLANAGADSVFWFKATDTGGWCPNGQINRNGLLDENLIPKEQYGALQDLALRLPEPLFVDGFYSGDTSVWSATVP